MMKNIKSGVFKTLPFLPEEFLYEVIPSAKNQYEIVSQLLNREDVDTIYVCTDSRGVEGESRLPFGRADVEESKRQRKAEETCLESTTDRRRDFAWHPRGKRSVARISDNLSDSAYLRAKEDYLMGINFSRLLTLKYGNTLANYLHERYTVISVGRVMTCVQGSGGTTGT